MLNAPSILHRNSKKWTPPHVCRMYKKSVYKGLFIWGTTNKIRNPLTKTVEKVAVPQEKWTVREYPELRLVSDEDWEKAQPKKNKTKANPTKQDMAYPLYNKVTCAECGNNMNISHSKKAQQIRRSL